MELFETRSKYREACRRETEVDAPEEEPVPDAGANASNAPRFLLTCTSASPLLSS
jgi:hypothetical protein